ncbi:MAG: hypothetical protein K6G10_01395 [Butyrivibrio sp.]|nr:hypothetical protein [Butyrivibrio sp.]
MHGHDYEQSSVAFLLKLGRGFGAVGLFSFLMCVMGCIDAPFEHECGMFALVCFTVSVILFIIAGIAYYEAE